MLFYFNQLKSSWFTVCKIEKHIQFSQEAIDVDEDIGMTDELFRNENVERDCALSGEEVSSFNFLWSPFSFISFPKLLKP